MKKLFFLTYLLIFGGFISAQEKPSLTEKDLEKYTYYFDIVDNKFVGDGAKFLTDEMKQSQYVLIGEYHFSFQISKFTKAVIPVYHEAGCRTFGLEIGPTTAEILTELSKNPDKTAENLKNINSKYYFTSKRGTVYNSIPFFKYLEDSEFLSEATKRKWNLIGFDQEFYIGFIPNIEQMYNNLTDKKKKELKDLRGQVISELESLIKDNFLSDDSKTFVKIYDSKEINRFLESASEKNPKNKKIADEIKISTEIYRYNELGEYYQNNNSRAEYMKKNLAENFTKLKFDLKKDKMLLKMGGLHTSRGLSRFDIADFGNILSELAAFNGNRSLHLVFGYRYFVKDGVETDSLNTPKDKPDVFQPFLQMAKRDKWVIIDLRKLRPAVFSSLFSFNPLIRQTILGKDLYIIPPMEKDPTPNYVLKN
ncbi:MAG: hypothetical protein K1X72_28270 [Pyrinomonadaceae bacterium]|nr:hypothetical protein [Pyrinomonadaceae bacterium]